MERGDANSLFWKAIFTPYNLEKANTKTRMRALVLQDGGTNNDVFQELCRIDGVEVVESMEATGFTNNVALDKYTDIVVFLGHNSGELPHTSPSFFQNPVLQLFHIFRVVKEYKTKYKTSPAPNIRVVTLFTREHMEHERQCDVVPHPDTAGYPLWTLVRAVNLEQTYSQDWQTQCIELADITRETQAIFAEILISDISKEAPLVRVKEGKTYTPQLDKYRPDSMVNKQIRSDGAYIVSGGRTGLGWKTVEMLLSRGAGYVIILSRSTRNNLDENQRQLFDTNEAKIFWPRPVDITCPAQLKDVLRLFSKTHDSVPILGIFHSAAVFHEKFVTNLTEAEIEASLKPKVDGALNLYEAVKDVHSIESIEHFIVYSTIACVIGNAAQGAYVAANAGAESVVHRLRMLGVPAQSIQWSALNAAWQCSRTRILSKVLTLAFARMLRDL